MFFRAVTILTVLGCLAGTPAQAQAQPAPQLPPNSGFPGSACVPVVNGTRDDVGPPPDGVSNTVLDADAPPAYYEWGQTTGDFANRPSYGLFIIVHGGFWFQTGAQAVVAERAGADFLRARGWQTLAVDYRGCAQSVDDLIAFYDIARKRLGPDTPICVTGQSNGGQMALLLAAQRPSLNCAIAEGAPIDLLSIGVQQAYVDPNPLPAIALPTGLSGPALFQNFAIAAFGANRLAEFSPILYTNVYAHSGQRILVAGGQNDVLVPTDQLREIGPSVAILNPEAYFRTVVLPPPDASGSVFFLHGFISGDASRALISELDALVAPYVQPVSAGAAPPSGKSD